MIHQTQTQTLDQTPEYANTRKYPRRMNTSKNEEKESGDGQTNATE